MITKLLKKTIFISKVTLLFILFALLFSLSFVDAQSELTMVLGNSINNSDIDGVIGDEWDDITSFNNQEISPQGNAQIWLKHDQSHLYIAVVFEADSNNPWAALQLGNPNCMTSNTDGAIFGHDELSPDGYQDISFGGFGVIRSDTSQDGVGSMGISMNTVTIELKKPLNTQDATGNDIQWSEDNSYDIIIMWDSNGGGSSGGTTSHTSNNPKPKTIYLEPQGIQPSPTPTQSPSPTPSPSPSPAFPDLLMFVAIFAIGIIVIAILIYFKKRSK